MAVKPSSLPEEEEPALDASSFLLPPRPHYVASTAVGENIPNSLARVVELRGLEDATDALSELESHLEKAAALAMQKPDLARSKGVTARFQKLSMAIEGAPFSSVPLWSDKAARKGRNPAQFIRSEYLNDAEPDGSITRRMIAKRDPQLGAAYAKHIERYEEDAVWRDTDGKKAQRDLGRMTKKEILDHTRQLARDRKNRSKIKTQRAP